MITIIHILKKNKYLIINIVLILISTLYLQHGFNNLLKDNYNLPVDLALRYWHTKDLIINKTNIFSYTEHPLYPPSFFIILSPFLAFTRYNWADFVWAILNLLYLSIISIWLFKISSSETIVKKLFLPLSFLCFHSITQGIGIGQVTVFIVGNLVFYLWLKEKEINKLIRFIAIFCLTISLNKYSLLIPFAIVLFFNKKYRFDLILAVFINLLFSWIALNHVGSTFSEFFKGLITNSTYVKQLGSLDIQSFISLLGLPNYIHYLSIVILFSLFIFFILYYKKLSIYDEFAIAALVSRFFIYHAHYDNVILLFVVIALWKRLLILKESPKIVLILGLLIFSLIIPARFLEWSYPFYGIGLLYQLCIWLYAGYVVLLNSKNDTIYQPDVIDN